MTQPRPTTQPTGEEGYLLLGLVVACFLLLLFLGVAAPTVAKQLERDREVESEHRALEYVRAIQLYYKKTNRYPTSVDELLGNAAGSGGMSLGGSSTNVHYLRQKYIDPLTGGDYRLIHFGEAKTEVKGFFGEPLDGVPAGNLGAAAGMQSNPGTSPAGTFGGAAGGASAAGSPTTGLPGAAGTGAGAASGGFGSSSGSSSGGFGSSSGTSATSFQGSKGAIIGVGSDAKGHGLVEWNGSENIQDWEFLYDPRVEILKAKVSIFGGSPAASGSGSLGSGFAPATGSNGAGNGLGTGNTGGFGSSSSFGGSSGGFGSSTGSTPTAPATPATGGSTPPTQ